MVIKPFIIGIAGGTGSGKSTLAARLTKAIGEDRVINIAHDNYYKDQSGLTKAQRDATNYDHPGAYDTNLLISHLQDLISDKPIDQPVYDFIEDTRSKQTIHLSPRPIIIVEGILVLADKNLRNLFNLKIYVDTDLDLRLLRRIKRDTEEVGHSFSYVMDKYLSQVKPMHKQFVEPTKQYADLVIVENNMQDIYLAPILKMLK